MICKDEFLKNTDVQEFLKFLAGFVCGTASFDHEYYDSDRKITCRFNSLQDAYTNYYFELKKTFRPPAGSYTDFNANKSVLINLKDNLRTAFPGCPSGASETDLLDESKKVFEWGGTANGNSCWLDGYADGGGSLCALYENANAIFGSDCPDLSDIGQHSVRSNAGFTKVYSLLFDDFIIYDARVAAALQLFVSGYCIENELSAPPNLLDFASMPSRGGHVRLVRRFRFKQTGGTNHPLHADSNIRANWLLSELFNTSCKDTIFGAISDKQDKMRALEAALFMIGYNLNGHTWV